ncbi:MAG TPA: hypothetical protein VN253_22410 [Kofleriaceae bacterium]|nr:hypothetical protein [Kofleriaceae bacterium]
MARYTKETAQLAERESWTFVRYLHQAADPTEPIGWHSTYGDARLST